MPIYNFRRRLQAGQVRQSDTLEGLADELGIDEVSLTETVHTYNEALASRRPDAFLRTTLCGGVGSPVPIVGPPFYGFPLTTVVLARTAASR